MTIITLEQATDFFAKVYRGAHHIDGILKPDGRGFKISVYIGDVGLSTFDGDELTRMVALAHDRAYRLAIRSSSPNRLSIAIHPRSREKGAEEWLEQWHPSLEEVVEKWRADDGQTWSNSQAEKRRETRRFAASEFRKAAAERRSRVAGDDGSAAEMDQRAEELERT